MDYSAPGEWKSRPNIPGIEDVVARFGGWPFHDSEILEIHLHRSKVSWIRVLDVSPEMDENTVVTFYLEDIIDMNLEGFSHQNNIDKLAIEELDNGYRLTFEPNGFFAGFIKARRIRIEVTPVETCDE